MSRFKWMNKLIKAEMNEAQHRHRPTLEINMAAAKLGDEFQWPDITQDRQYQWIEYRHPLTLKSVGIAYTYTVTFNNFR